MSNMHLTFGDQDELCRHKFIRLRVCGKNVHTVFHVLLIFTFRLEHEPLEDVVVVRNNAAYG